MNRRQGVDGGSLPQSPDGDSPLIRGGQGDEGTMEGWTVMNRKQIENCCPCRGCAERYAACHDRCERRAVWCGKLEADRVARNAEKHTESDWFWSGDGRKARGR